MAFWFRKSFQCATDQPWAIKSPPPLRLYEPAWVQVLGLYETLNGIQDTVYKEEAKWEHGRPWPGAEIEPTAKYIELENGIPFNLIENGFNRSREEVMDSAPNVEHLIISSYKIRK